jgi:hypothetical protein
VNADGDCVEDGGESLAAKEDPCILGAVGLGGIGSGAGAADACEQEIQVPRRMMASANAGEIGALQARISKNCPGC